jgi:HEAT repeat protein
MQVRDPEEGLDSMIRIRLGRLLLSLLLVLATLAGHAGAQDGTRCVCEHREACYHFLNSPVAVPDDPCPCAKCAGGDVHSPGEQVPDGWNEACFASNRLDCFLKRHAASWKITCSACFASDSCCPFPHQGTCPRCGDVGHADPFVKDAMRQPARESMAEQLGIEQEFFDEKKVVVAYSRRFYLVTDIPKIRLMDQTGKVRWATTHEYAHLMLQRAEVAYDEMAKALGGRIKLLRPMGIYLPKSERAGRKLQDVYFRNERNHMIYSSYPGRSESAISGSFCLNGFCVPLERMKKSAAATRSLAGDDYAMHGAMRHLMAHVLITCWIKHHGENRTMPRWAFVGAAHWFCKRVEKHRDIVYYCTGEVGKINGPGKDWRERLRKRAIADDLAPIEQLLRKSSLGQLGYDDHVQCWGYFALAMESDDWREGWIRMLADLRDEKDVRTAFQERLNMTPEAYHVAWRERLLGREELREAPDVADPSAKGLDAMMAPPELAAAIQGLGKITEPAEVRAVLDLIGVVRSDLVRETALEVFLKIEDADARAALVEGLGHDKPLARAYAARACRLLGLADAKLALRALLGDAHWLVRSEAALGCATLRDYDAQRGIRDMTLDASPKARIAAMDALALFGEEVNSICLPVVVKNLTHRRWQVQIAAAQCLARIGDHEVVTPIVDLLDKEAGRVQEELLATLHALSGEEFGDDIPRWKKWWEMERPHAEERGGLDVTGKTDEEKPEVPSRYAKDEPEYYGERVYSQRVVFVLDVSRSTNRNFHPDDGTRERLLGAYVDETTTITRITQAELARGIDQLDPRARFNVICFATDVWPWQNGLQTASAGNKRSAAAFTRARSPNGETNFHGALLAALELDENPWASSDLRNTADTVNFLTDGSPTAGDVTDPEQVARWFVELNRYARARLNVFVFGTLGVNETFLQRLARDGGGTFTQLFESNPR